MGLENLLERYKRQPRSILMTELDQDAQSKQRIKTWLHAVWHDYYLHNDDVAALLLEFEKYLQACEAERMDK